MSISLILPSRQTAFLKPAMTSWYLQESLLSCFQWLTETEQLDEDGYRGPHDQLNSWLLGMSPARYLLCSEDNGLWCDGCHQKVQAFSHVSLAMLPLLGFLNPGDYWKP